MHLVAVLMKYVTMYWVKRCSCAEVIDCSELHGDGDNGNTAVTVEIRGNGDNISLIYRVIVGMDSAAIPWEWGRVPVVLLTVSFFTMWFVIYRHNCK